jgi:dTDP-4-amino-4,6-dideoxygalactose transaminase
MTLIPHSASTLGPAEAAAMREVVQRNFAGHGPQAAELEERFRRRTGRRYAFAVSSGHHSLALAVRALDLPPASNIALPVLTCASVAAAILDAGHRCRLVDVREDLTLDVALIGGESAAAVAPHAYGAPVDVAALAGSGRPWIEDCATSPATTSDGKTVGSFGSLSVFSLGATKYLTGGSGGILVTDESALAARVGDLLDFDSAEAKGEWSRCQPVALPGRLCDLNAAVALVQLDRLEEFAARRRAIAALYDDAVMKSPYLRQIPARAGHSYYRYIIKTGSPSAPVAAWLRGRGIDARTAVNPWLDSPRFSGVSFVPGAFPVADRWRDHLFSLPIYPGLSDDDVQTIVRALQEFPDHA